MGGWVGEWVSECGREGWRVSYRILVYDTNVIFIPYYIVPWFLCRKSVSKNPPTTKAIRYKIEKRL